MNFQFYVEKLKSSQEYKKFMKENKDAFPCSCFFLMDKAGGAKQHIDFYIPSTGKMISFALENEIEILLMDASAGKKMPKISLSHDFDFNDIEKLVLERMEQEGMKNKLQKMLLSMQSLNGKDFFSGTIFVSGLGLINMTLDITDMNITDFKKRSLLDMMTLFKKDKDEKKE